MAERHDAAVSKPTATAAAETSKKERATTHRILPGQVRACTSDFLFLELHLLAQRLSLPGNTPSVLNRSHGHRTLRASQHLTGRRSRAELAKPKAGLAPAALNEHYSNCALVFGVLLQSELRSMFRAVLLGGVPVNWGSLKPLLQRDRS